MSLFDVIIAYVLLAHVVSFAAPLSAGVDRIRQFGATDFMDPGASARPNTKADGLPQGFDMKYAKQKYEAGRLAGILPVA